jgi:ribosome-associated protein
MDTLVTARLIVESIAGKLGSDILLLDISEVTQLADYFVIASGESSRQLNAMADDIRQQVKQLDGVTPHATEGSADSGWVLVDYGGIVVHLFSQAQRQRYQLEELWSSARTVVRIA